MISPFKCYNAIVAAREKCVVRNFRSLKNRSAKKEREASDGTEQHYDCASR
jgi:hypothetical protein